MDWFANLTMVVILHCLNKVFWVETGKSFPDRWAWGGRNGLEPSYPGWSPSALHYATPAHDPAPSRMFLLSLFPFPRYRQRQQPATGGDTINSQTTPCPAIWQGQNPSTSPNLGDSIFGLVR
jgi:hypothetical protein